MTLAGAVWFLALFSTMSVQTSDAADRGLPDRPAADHAVGYDDPRLQRDTWEWDGSAWMEIHRSPDAARMPAAPLTAAPAGQAASAQHADIMRPDAFEIVDLGDGVHAVLRRDPPDDAANANSLVIINDTDVVVVDANLTPASSEATIAAIRRLTSKPVRYVVNTHWHDDHVLGNGAYATAFPGVEFIGHPATRQKIVESVWPTLQNNITAYADELRAQEEKLANNVSSTGAPLTTAQRHAVERYAALLRGFLREAPNVRLTPPTLLVDSELTLWRGDREIRIAFLGHGNTAGDLVVHLPKEGIVASGDLLVSPIPYAFGSYLGDWIDTLTKLEAMGARTIVPGHGPVMRDTTYLNQVRELVGAMRTQIAASVAKGLSLEEARKALDLETYRTMFAGEDPGLRAAFDSLFVTPASERAFLEAKGEMDK